MTVRIIYRYRALEDQEYGLALPSNFRSLTSPLLIERFPSFTFHSSVRNLGVVLDSTLIPSQNMLLISLDRPISTSGALEQSDAPSPLMSLPQLSMPSSALA